MYMVYSYVNKETVTQNSIKTFNATIVAHESCSTKTCCACNILVQKMLQF